LNFLPIAYSIFLVNFVFGLLVKKRIIDSTRFRFVHHMLYFFVVASLLVATALAFIEGSERRWLQAGMAGLLLCMPFFRGRSRGHWIYATLCCAVYSAIVFWQ
jgi:hypothetical protein